jgi:hypothetical protein
MFMIFPRNTDVNDSSASSVVPSTATAADKREAQRQKLILYKNDKRRQYAKLYAEAFNSGDPKVLLAFLQEYCTPNCFLIQSCVVKENPYIPKHVEARGIDAIFEFWSNMFLTIPDCLIVMLESKLRIKNNKNPSTVTTSSGEVIPSVTSGSITRNEGSSIVSSFSFTGTKLYNMDVKGAITKQMSEMSAIWNGSYTTSTSSSNSTSSKLLLAGPTKQLQTIMKNQSKANKKRSLNSDWPNNSATSDPTSGCSTALTTDSNTPTTNEVAANSNKPIPDVNDRYNIFLHPPKRFSTLAGTPFGGSSHSHYYHPPKPNLKNVNKTSDYVEITSNTKIAPGSYLEAEGHINFLGTLTMFLDSENKICRFEFLYSHMD